MNQLNHYIHLISNFHFKYYFIITILTCLIWILFIYLLNKPILGKNNVFKFYQLLSLTNNNLLLLFTLISVFMYFFWYSLIYSDPIHLDTIENITLYKNVYIKGLNPIVHKYGELNAYAVGVKLATVFLKIPQPLPAEFEYHIGFHYGTPKIALQVTKEDITTLDLMGNEHSHKVYLHVKSIEENVDFMRDMVPRDYLTYHITKFKNLENNTTIISGDAPTDLNSPLELSDTVYFMSHHFMYGIIFILSIFIFILWVNYNHKNKNDTI